MANAFTLQSSSCRGAQAGYACVQCEFMNLPSGIQDSYTQRAENFDLCDFTSLRRFSWKKPLHEMCSVLPMEQIEVRALPFSYRFEVFLLGVRIRPL